jgi:DNA adenine methylase
MEYPGGKNGAGVYQRIVNLCPPHKVYIEPFLGSGAIFRLKRPADLNIGVDLDPAALELALPAASPDRMMAISAEPGVSVETRRQRAAKLAMPDPLAEWIEGRSMYELYQTDGIAFLESYAFTGLELVYADPPYVISTRSKTSYGCGGALRYKYEMADGDHRRLLRVLLELPCKVILSGYDSPMYADALDKWAHTTFQAMTHRGVHKTESLWCNFPAPVELHDYRFLGANFRERENTKRMIRRLRARLAKMPLLRRQALLAAVADIG